MEIPKVYICILDNDGVIEIADYVIANHIDEVKDLYDMCI